MPLKYDQIEEVEAIVRRIVKAEAPGAVVQNYNDDGQIRQMVRGSVKIDESIASVIKKLNKDADAPKAKVKRPEPLAKASISVPSDGGILVGKQSSK